MSQNYQNHRLFVPMYHFFCAILLLAILIGAFVNLFKIPEGGNIYSASLIVAITVLLTLFYLYIRLFPLKAQDRAIRAEERLRYFIMEGKAMDPKLSIRQIIGLRFASDEEFVELCKRAVAENLSEEDIKKAIKNWKADNDRA